MREGGGGRGERRGGEEEGRLGMKLGTSLVLRMSLQTFGANVSLSGFFQLQFKSSLQYIWKCNISRYLGNRIYCCSYLSCYALT